MHLGLKNKIIFLELLMTTDKIHEEISKCGFVPILNLFLDPSNTTFDLWKVAMFVVKKHSFDLGMNFIVFFHHIIILLLWVRGDTIVTI